MVIIGLDQILSNSALYEHIFPENTRKIYKLAGKCDDQQQNKTIIEAAMVSNTERFTFISSMSYDPSMPVKQNNTRN